jgi:hypothetical protein
MGVIPPMPQRYGTPFTVKYTPRGATINF